MTTAVILGRVYLRDTQIKDKWRKEGAERRGKEGRREARPELEDGTVRGGGSAHPG